MQVPFHGRAVRGWVLGPTDDVPKSVLEVKKVVSPTRWFDEAGLSLCRWVSERYVAPMAAVLERATPPRVAAEENRGRAGWRRVAPVALPPPVLEGYREGPRLVEAIVAGGPGAWVLRPAPEHESAVVVEAVARCLGTGRRALVIVPEAAPVPGTAKAIAAAFGDDRVARLLGGSKRARYRTWLDVQAGGYDVVVGTRPSIFAPVPDLGLIVVGRESHPALREDRAPYYHVRDVALARGEIERAVVVMSAMAPSSEAAALALPTVAPRRRSWVPVEIVSPGPEGRAPRLVRALRESTRAFLFSPLPGYGIAAVCRACGQPAACAVCHGVLRSSEGAVRCVVCEAPGRCRACGASDFGLRRGGQERVEEWAARVASVPVHRLAADDAPRLPTDGEVLVGGPDDVRDFGDAGLDLVAILDADLAGRRPGLTARERAVTTWTEAIAWARPGGRAIVQSAQANDPAIQSLVLGDPARFHRDERERRAQAGFPVGSAVFRVVGDAHLADELAALEPITLLVSTAEGQTVCLLALDPGSVAAFGRQARALAVRDVITRVEAEPHL